MRPSLRQLRQAEAAIIDSHRIHNASSICSTILLSNQQHAQYDSFPQAAINKAERYHTEAVHAQTELPQELKMVAGQKPQHLQAISRRRHHAGEQTFDARMAAASTMPPNKCCQPAAPANSSTNTTHPIRSRCCSCHSLSTSRAGDDSYQVASASTAP